MQRPFHISRATACKTLRLAFESLPRVAMSAQPALEIELPRAWQTPHTLLLSLTPTGFGDACSFLEPSGALGLNRPLNLVAGVDPAVRPPYDIEDLGEAVLRQYARTRTRSI